LTRSIARNTSASVHDRLLLIAKAQHRPFNDVLQHYALERFLARLTQSIHRDKLILKGALMLQVWRGADNRPTRDIDFLGRTSNEIESVISMIREICLLAADEDGILFDDTSVTSERITEGADYHGVRVTFRGKLGNAKIGMQLDIGFGDQIYPQPELISYPTLLKNMPPPQLLGYSKESVVAEKAEAMIKLGEINSRMKDFYDVMALSRQFNFDGTTLTQAFHETFRQRGTAVPLQPVIFNERFRNDPERCVQWRAFLTKNALLDASHEFSAVVLAVQKFLEPVLDSLQRSCLLTAKWSANEGWR
jgi:hypothetical protein